MSREDLQKTIGMVAREARERMGLTQTEVAQRINVTPQQYGGIERGNLLPSTSTLRAIAETLGVSADVLLGLREAPRRPEGRGQSCPAGVARNGERYARGGGTACG